MHRSRTKFVRKISLKHQKTAILINLKLARPLQCLNERGHLAGVDN